MNPGFYLWTWPDGSSAAQYALSSDRGRKDRLLIIPALFDEGHRMRRLCVDVMHRLDGGGVDSLLPDLPGTDESLVELPDLSLDDWRRACRDAAREFGATHVLAMRGGGLVAPGGLTGWHYGPLRGETLLRTLIRARVLARREAGTNEDRETLLTEGRVHGLELAGYRIGGAMIRQLEVAEPSGHLKPIDNEVIGGSPLWLRAEPDADAAQADALAAYLLMALRA